MKYVVCWHLWQKSSKQKTSGLVTRDDSEREVRARFRDSVEFSKCLEIFNCTGRIQRKILLIKYSVS